ILENKEPLLAQGRKVVWHPSHMIKRFEQWVEGLNQDWCVSRQRFFGVPFPIWYPLNGEGEPDYENPIFAKKETLPVDPLADCPPGYTSQQRNQPGGFIGDPDVMDTWATSSCTPQISSHWGIDEKRHNSLFPADLRPQAHEIIRTWAFYTITKAWMHEEKIPWENIAISGWVVNPDREKMSKSKGNTVTPEDLITQYSADALRYWASKARLGTDTIYDENVFKVGQRLSTKIFNASKFVMMQLSDDSETTKDLSWDLSSIKEPVDLVWVSRMNQLLINAKKLFSEYDYAVALSQIETSFWEFCDLYVELVKTRAYKQKESAAGLSALATLEWTLQNFLQLFAPVLPYITEEVWSWHYAEKNGEASIHTSSWPTPIELAKIEISATNNEADLIGLTKEIMNAVRGEKSKAQKNLRWPVETISVCGEKPNLEKLKLVEEDLIQSCSLKNSIEYQEGQKAEDGHFSITVTLAETND
ncbi:MAG: class I tRNA ligase family protein, partial [Halobacteriovoraceae bacterium]|nr:class I tRNA ligase family protein [Halobacteriovoraceae bacterium]